MKRSISWLTAGAALTVILVAVNLILTTRNTRQLNEDAQWVQHTQLVITGLENILTLTTAAETGQRGFIITGEPRYLVPYDMATASINRQVDETERIAADNPQQQSRFIELRKRIETRWRILEELINIRRNEGFDAARLSILTDRGKNEMDGIRALVDEMILHERTLLSVRAQQSEKTYRTALISELIAGVMALAAVIAFILLLRRYLGSQNEATAIISEQAEKLRVTLASIGDAVITTDLDGNITNTNAVAESLTGWNNHEAAGKPLDSIFNIVNEVTRQPVENPAAKALKQGIVVGLANHAILIARDGSESPIDDSAAPIRDEEGNVTGVVLIFRDITERKQAELELHRSEEQRRLALESAELGTWNINPAINLLTADHRFSEIFGVDIERLDYESAFAAIHPDDLDGVRDAVAAAIRPDNPKPYFTEYRVVHSDGSIHWVSAQGRANFKGQGPERILTSFDGTINDITQRRQEEIRRRALVDLADRFRELEEPADISYAAAEILGRHLDVSRAGYGTVDPVAETISIERDWTAPDIKSLAGTLNFRDYGSYIEDLKRGETVIFADAEKDPRTASTHFALKAISALSVVNIPIIEQGELVALLYLNNATPREWKAEELFFVREVAERTRMAVERRRARHLLRDSERSFRQLADTMPQIVWTANPEGTLDYYNSRWFEYIDLHPDSFDEARWDLYIHSDDLPLAVDAWAKALDSGNPYSTEFRIKRADGNYRWFLVRSLPVLNSDGEIIRWFGTCTDIHQQKQTAEELRQLAASLSEADHRKNEFLAMLAHELRNPLAPIRNALQIIRLTKDGEASAATEMMERQVGQLVRLVDDLLDVSRITQDKIELRLERIELSTVVHHAIEAARPSCEAGGVDLRVNISSEPIYLNGDQTRIAQVIGNLLNNACKFTDKGGIIDLIVKREGNHALICVRDTGIGIAPNQISSIFQLFVQADTSLERSMSGLGIGLTLVKNLVEMHGGEIEAKSDGLGQGSEFIVRLPVLMESVTPSSNFMTITEKTVTSRRILVVDDNIDSAESLAMLLEITGHEVRMAHDGREAVNVASAFLPEVILLDIGLPKLNGYEAAREIRQHPWGVKMTLIALTGWGQDEDRQKSKDAGFDSHMVKPVDHIELMKRLEELPELETST